MRLDPIKIVASLFIFFSITAVLWLKDQVNSSTKALESDVPIETFDKILFVSVAGGDSGDGSRENPFNSIVDARDAVRELLAKSDYEHIGVLIRGGTYNLTETVVFGVRDSAPDGVSVTYTAYPGEEPVFTSGVNLGPWVKLEKPIEGLDTHYQENVWVTELPAALERPRVLFDHDKLLPRAQSQGFNLTNDINKKREWNTNWFPDPANMFRAWTNIEDVEIRILPRHVWLMDMHQLKSVNESTREVTTQFRSTYPMTKIKFSHTGLPSNIWIENAIDYLDKPGEWVVDTRKRKIFLIPQGDSPGDHIVAPSLAELFRVEGEIDFDGPVDTPVQGLVFKGLTFRHAKRHERFDNYVSKGIGYELFDFPNALLRFRGAEGCKVIDCLFEATGDGAVRLDLHAQNNLIQGNTIRNIGGTGIVLCGYGPGTKDVNKNNLVLNNHIHHFSNIFWGNSAIYVWQSGENRIAHNLIHHGPNGGIMLMGVSVHNKGFARVEPGKANSHAADLPRWKEIDEVRNVPQGFQVFADSLEFLHARNNLVEYNELHNLLSVMGDMNALYCYDPGKGNIFSRNHVHDIFGIAAQAVMRTDGPALDVTIKENVFESCSGMAISLKNNNRAINNIFIDAFHPIYRSRQFDNYGKREHRHYIRLTGDNKDMVLKNNILYSTKSNETTLYGESKASQYYANDASVANAKVVDNNVYFSPDEPDWGRDWLNNNRDKGKDTNSIIADPMFQDLVGGNYLLMPGSPALERGFVQLDVSEMGPEPPYRSRFEASLENYEAQTYFPWSAETARKHQ